MAVRDTHYVELVQRERLAEAALEREASVAARDGWIREPGPGDEPEPERSLGQDIFRSVLKAVVHGLFAVGLVIEGGWLRWLGSVFLALLAAMVAASTRRIGRRLIERR